MNFKEFLQRKSGNEYSLHSLLEGMNEREFLNAVDEYKLFKEPVAHNLTEREHATLTLLSYGITNREIAEELNLSQRTIETYRKSIISMLNANNSCEAIAIAIRTNIIL